MIAQAELDGVGVDVLVVVELDAPAILNPGGVHRQDSASQDDLGHGRKRVS
jgi:hypothetical protein